MTHHTAIATPMTPSASVTGPRYQDSHSIECS